MRSQLATWFAIGAALFATPCVLSAAPASAPTYTSVRQLLGELGFGDDEFDQFVGGNDVTANELVPLATVLHHLSQLPPTILDQWARRGFSGSRLQDDPLSYRGELIALSGSLERVERQALPSELAERFDLAAVYRCRVKLEGGGEAVVFAREVPGKWQVEATHDEPVSFDGVLLKAGAGGEAGRSELYFAAPRLEWHPRTELGSAGLDYGLIDRIEQRKPILAGETEVFYQFLAAASQAGLSQLLKAADGTTWSVVPPSPQAAKLAEQLRQRNPSLRLLMMGQAEEYIGQLMRFEGRVHRCVRVAIDDPILADALGFDHYYELALFIPLDYELSFAGGAAAGGTRGGAAHTDLYPVFACVKQLPPGFPTGEQLNEVADVAGYFFKLWAYPTRFGAVDQAQRIEYSPLIMGPGFRWVSRPHAENSGWALIAGMAFLGVLALLGFVLWRVGRRDLAFRRELAARRSEARQQPELGRPEGSPASE